MSARATHDVVATMGEYTNAQGETKKRYMNVGVVFTNQETGNMSIKLNALPVGPDWSGFLSLYPKEDKRRQMPNHGTPQQPIPAQSPINETEDIPF